MYATTRVFDQISFGEGVEPLPKEDAQKEIEDASRKSLTWTILFKRAFEMGANHVQVTPQNSNFKLNFCKDGNEMASEPIDIVDFQKLRDFYSPGSLTMYAQTNNERFTLTLKSDNPSKNHEPTLEMIIEPYD